MESEITLNRKFEDAYVRELSIQDHCHEINHLYDERRITKAYHHRISDMENYRSALEEAIEGEQIDLLLILMKHFGIKVDEESIPDKVWLRLTGFRLKEEAADADKECKS